MEPSDLSSRDEQQLEAWLRQNTRSPIADDGFTARVLAQLPPPRQSAPARWTRPIATALGCLAGVIVVWNHGVSSDELVSGWEQVLAQLCRPDVIFATLAVVATFVVVYVPEWRRRWL